MYSWCPEYNDNEKRLVLEYLIYYLAKFFKYMVIKNGSVIDLYFFTRAGNIFGMNNQITYHRFR